MKLLNPTRLTLDELLPSAELFANQSSKHGVAHVSRVMINGFLLVDLTERPDLALPLWAAVFVHDLARTGDGICHHHGPAAALLLEESPELRGRVLAGGVAESDLPAIATAVHTHSHGELPKEHPHYALTALLKDADGLDRVRLGDLDPSYFRFSVTVKLAQFAGELFADTDHWETTAPDYMTRLWARADELAPEIGRGT